jgi:hypothetical protein
MDRRGRPGVGRAEDLPYDASSPGALAPKDTLLLYISTSTRMVSGPGGGTT